MCALLVPRAAWSMHGADHDRPVTSGQQHVHHDDHIHDVAAVADHHGGVDSSTDEGDEPIGGLPHDHRPADVLSVMAGADLAAFTDDRLPYPDLHEPQRPSPGDPATAYSSILRPPQPI
jgi:hypothetical protein